MSIRPEHRSAAAAYSPPWHESRPRSAKPGAPDPWLTEAIRGLLARRPEFSARGPLPRWLIPFMALLAAAFGFGVVLEPTVTGVAVGVGLMLPFAGITVLRFSGALESLRRPPARTLLPALPPRFTAGGLSRREWPYYSVLVPLYDEPDILPHLVEGLSAIDYPPDRIEILLVLEQRDLATRRRAATLRLPPQFKIVLVPSGGPRTKPKALNYALSFASGDLLVVFDAEDRPERDQLRRAALAFTAAGPKLVCLQARLNVYNPGASFFTRQFALEYSALFDGFLPGLERLGLPIPLGGTSNHFRLRALREVGAWDPYNVTEDADLGIRLARLGYRTATFASTTWEEAPHTGKIWLGQRTRWLKGWMQTWLVHMRRPFRLCREIGIWRFIGVQVMTAGILLAVLVYPLALAALLVAILFGGLDALGAMGWLYPIAVGHLVVGVATPMLAAALAAVRRRRAWLALSVIWMPIYWLLISLAGYRALVELFVRPFHWEKTRHGLGHRPPSPRRRR